LADESDEDRLRRLEARIRAVKGKDAPRQDEHYSQAQVGWRMVTELVAGLGIGFVIGLGLDTLFGTTPFLMIVFLMAGFAAGVKTMLRTARELQGAQAGRAEDEKEG
jgi:ATP synthase protein I